MLDTRTSTKQTNRQTKNLNDCGQSSLFSYILSNINVTIIVQSVQSCSPLCDTVDYSPPGSSVHGIFQARLLDWIANLYSRGSSRTRNQIGISKSPALQADSLPLSHWEAHKIQYLFKTQLHSWRKIFIFYKLYIIPFKSLLLSCVNLVLKFLDKKGSHSILLKCFSQCRV